MCGIAGIITPCASEYHDRLTSMVSSLRHRGPDDQGMYFFGNCALGHARLSIIDIQGGRQPMLSYDQLLGLTFNGEIYGYKKLRQDLHYPFQTSSDTEVILALYQEHHHQMLDYLPGMFSFALWDEKRQSLYCARDRFGEKPFYYAIGDGGEFIFSSEIKAILATNLLKPKLNLEALAHYLQRLYVHPTQTIYSNIHTLPPAHFLVYGNNTYTVKPYWKFPLTDDHISISDAVEKFQLLLEKAVVNQLIADVPVGAFLSGGLDSSTIVSIAGRYCDHIKTFSFGFEGDHSELPYARAVADKYQTDHTELHDTNTRLGELLIDMQKVYDEPFADSSNIPSYLIAKLAREHTKVILSGDGADELIAGYSYWYNPLLIMKKRMKYPYFMKLLMINLAHITTKLRLPLPPEFARHLQGIINLKNCKTIEEAHRLQTLQFTSQELIHLGISPWRPNTTYHHMNNIDDALRMDLQDYMPGDILVKIDRATMAHGLELRAPFLDVDFASFCISLPYNMKITSTRDKEILRLSYEKYWPLLVQTRSKQGFGAPVSEWMKRPELQKIKQDYLQNKQNKIFSIFDKINLDAYIDADNSRTWILLVLSIWMEQNQFSVN